MNSELFCFSPLNSVMRSPRCVPATGRVAIPRFLLLVLFVLMFDGVRDVARAQANWGRPTYSSPIAISANDRLIWVVNPSDDSVSVIRPVWPASETKK